MNRRLSAALLLCTLAGCRVPKEPDEQILSLATASKVPLREVVEHADFAVVILVDPAECFACISNLARWIHWERRHPDQFFLVFTRSPSPIEQRQIALFRLQPDAVLANADASRLTTPREFLVRRGAISRSSRDWSLAQRVRWACWLTPRQDLPSMTTTVIRRAGTM
jgi:hypothetical protein